MSASLSLVVVVVLIDELLYDCFDKTPDPTESTSGAFETVLIYDLASDYLALIILPAALNTLLFWLFWLNLDYLSNYLRLCFEGALLSSSTCFFELI